VAEVAGHENLSTSVQCPHVWSVAENRLDVAAEADMKIISITVITTGMTDIVYLETELPDAVFPFVGTLAPSFRVAKDQGLAYVEKHFPGVPVNLSTTRREAK